MLDWGFNIFVATGLALIVAGVAGLVWASGLVVVSRDVFAAFARVRPEMAMTGVAQPGATVLMAALLLTLTLGVWWWVEGDADDVTHRRTARSVDNGRVDSSRSARAPASLNRSGKLVPETGQRLECPDVNAAIETRPFLKWAGGKRQLLPHLRGFYPATIGNYFEPFRRQRRRLFRLSASGRLGRGRWHSAMRTPT